MVRVRAVVSRRSDRVDGGVRFWRDNEAALARAQQDYGVPAEIIVAIIGVETSTAATPAAIA